MRPAGRTRPHVPGGTYYLVQLVSRDQRLLRHVQDATVLNAMIERSLARTATVALAYCWLPQTLHLAVRCHDISVSRFMQGWTSGYARYLHRGTSEVGHVFRQRFQSVLIDPQVWLPELARFIHHAPVRAQLAAAPIHYPHSSCAAYCAGAAAPAWLHSRLAFRILTQRGLDDRDARAFLCGSPPTGDLELFAINGHSDSRVLGVIPPVASTVKPTDRLNVTRIIDLVAQHLDLSRPAIFSASRAHDLALARAVIAWQVTERHLASLTQIAALLQRHPSTLSKAIALHRHAQPELFRLDLFHHLRPLA